MLHSLRFTDLDRLGNLPYVPPPVLWEAVEAAEARSEPWWVRAAWTDGGAEPVWVWAFPGSSEPDRCFVEGDVMAGQWDPGREVFLVEDGTAIDLRGRRRPTAELVTEEEAEDQGWSEDVHRRGRPSGPGERGGVGPF